MSYAQHEPVTTRYVVPRHGQGPLGDVPPPWTGAPDADPRYLRAYATVKARYTPVGISADKASSVPALLRNYAATKFPGATISWAGWTGASDPAGSGKVGFDVILPSTMRVGDINRNFYEIGLKVGPQVQGTSLLTQAHTYWDNNDLQSAPSTSTPGTTTSGGTTSGGTITPTTPDTTTTPTTTPDATTPGGFFGQEVMGVPVWGLVIGGVALVGVLGVVVLMKPKRSAATANKRHSRRTKRRAHAKRRHTRRRSRR